jgi:hypothetical protein
MSFNQIIEKNQNVIFVDLGERVKTAITAKTFKVVNDEDKIIMHFSIDELTSIELFDNSLKIYTSDEIPFVMVFSSNGEAEFANDRINDIINGQYIT